MNWAVQEAFGASPFPWAGAERSPSPSCAWSWSCCPGTAWSCCKDLKEILPHKAPVNKTELIIPKKALPCERDSCRGSLWPLLYQRGLSVGLAVSGVSPLGVTGSAPSLPCPP